MKDIYYIYEGKKFGPIQMGELIKHPISHDTYLWIQGLPDWVQAKHLPWMEEYLQSTPPPIPVQYTAVKSPLNKLSTKNTEEPFLAKKNTQAYQVNEGALIYGSMIVLADILLLLISFSNEETFPFFEYRVPMAGLSLYFRLTATIWVIKLAKEQKKEPILWLISALIFPGPTLIVSGSSKRILK